MNAVAIGQRLVPALLVRDMRATIAFYERLRFSVVGCHPDRESAVWAEVKREEICLQFHTEPASDDGHSRHDRD